MKIILKKLLKEVLKEVTCKLQKVLNKSAKSRDLEFLSQKSELKNRVTDYDITKPS